MLGSAESKEIRLIAVKLFFQNSNVYDHDTSTSQTDQTDRQTDGQTDNLPWQYRATPQNGQILHYVCPKNIVSVFWGPPCPPFPTPTTGPQGPHQLNPALH